MIVLPVVLAQHIQHDVTDTGCHAQHGRFALVVLGRPGPVAGHGLGFGNRRVEPFLNLQASY